MKIESTLHAAGMLIVLLALVAIMVVATQVSSQGISGVPDMGRPQAVAEETPILQTSPLITATWTRLGGPPGGLGYDIRMRPDNPDVMFVTDGFVGEYKSTDGGQSWFAANTGMELTPGAGTTAFCTTIDPHNHDIVWTGLQLSGHIYRSTDNGETWHQRDNGLLFEAGPRSVRGITVDPVDPDIVYAGLEVSSDVWAGQPINGRMEKVKGEVYKSVDAGDNWTRIWYGDNLARYIVVDPRNNQRIYVSTGLFDRDAANSDIPTGIWGGVGILRSDDGGETWTVLDEDNGLGGLYVPSLFMHPVNPDILVASVTYPADPGGEGVYVTRNGGDTWEKVLSAPGQWAGMDAVEISTSNPNVWYAAAESIVYRSDDAGENWQSFFMGTPGRAGGLPIDLQVDPRDPYRIFENAYGGGNIVSTDGGQTWVDASRGYSGARIRDVAVLPGAGWRVFANGFRSDDGGDHWTGRITSMAISSIVAYTSTHDTRARVMAAGQYGTVSHSTNAGTIWQTVQVTDTQGQLFDGILALTPSDSKLVYLGYADGQCILGRFNTGPEACQMPGPGFFRSTDGGTNWDHLSVSFSDVSIMALAVHPDEPGRLYAGTGKGLYSSLNAGEDWTHVAALDAVALSAGSLNPELISRTVPYVYDIAFDPFDSQVIYVTSEPGAVIVSRDGGTSWEQAAVGMDPNEPVNDILPDPNRPGVVYVSSKLSGVLVSTDGAQTWQPMANGLERRDVQVLALSEDGTVMYAGTASGSGGGGVWRMGTPAGSPPEPSSFVYLPMVLKAQ